MSPRQSGLLIIAAAIAVIGFLGIHAYIPKAGFVWNVMNGEIWFNEACPPPLPADNPFRDLVPAKHWWECGLSLRYRWILGFSIALAAGCLLATRRDK
jgi:hypothetical protein